MSFRNFGWIPLICFLTLIFPATAYASIDKVIYDSADFQVRLNEDGSADIVETWHVTFSSEDITQFNRNIRLIVLEPEKLFSDEENPDPDKALATVENLSVKVNGESCEESDTNSYTAKKSSDHHMITVYHEFENTSYVFEFTYTLKNIVLKLDDETSVFVHRFINVEYEEIGNINVVIQAPGECEFETIYSSDCEESIEGNTITYHTSDTDAFFEIEQKIKCDQAFGVEFSEIEPFETVGEYWHLILYAAYIIFAFVIYVRKETQPQKIQRIVSEDVNPNDIYDILRKWQGKVTGITQVTMLTQTSQLSIMGIFGELHKKGVIEFCENNSKISVDLKEHKNLCSYQRYLLDLLIVCKKEYDHENLNNYKEFPHEKFSLELEYLISFLDKECIHAKHYAEKIRFELERRCQFGYFKDAYRENSGQYTAKYQFEIDVERARTCIAMMKKEFPVTTFQDVLSDETNGDMNPFTYIAYVLTLEKRYQELEDKDNLPLEDLLFVKLTLL